MRVVTLSGWGQPHDALAVVAPGAHAIDYADTPDVEAALVKITNEAQDADAVIGWSLGGQLAARAVAEKRIAPKRLVLLAAPFRFVAPKGEVLGMKRDTYEKFRDNYAKNPARTLHKAWELVAMGDRRGDSVRAFLSRQDKQSMLEKDWLYWLEALETFDSAQASFRHFPPTLLVHGDGDAVVNVMQANVFSNLLPQSTLRIIEGAGHAPHWHDSAAVTQWIEEHAYV